MRSRTVLLTAFLVLIVALAGCANFSGGQPSTGEPSPPATTTTTVESTPSTATTPGTPSTTTHPANLTEPPDYDVLLINYLDTEATLSLRIQNQTNATVVKRAFTLPADSNRTQNLTYTSQEDGEYTITATHNNTTATRTTTRPWTLLIHLRVTPDGISIHLSAT